MAITAAQVEANGWILAITHIRQRSSITSPASP